jgi:hypothetical protein
MPTFPLASEGVPSSARSSISDLPMITTPRESTTIPLNEPDHRSPSYESNQSGGSMDDLDVEDPLSGIYAEFAEFEPFSKSEYGFIGVSCLGVLLIPSLFLLVTKLVCSSFKILLTVDVI